MRRILMTLIDARDLPVSERSINDVITIKKSS